MVLLARDIMDPDVHTVQSTATALECAKTMVERHKGYAVVIGPGGEMAGIVTEWDLIEKVIAGGLDAAAVRVSAIASPVVHSCPPETPAEDVVETMVAEGIRRLVVRTGNRVVGVVTSRDVLAMFRPYVDKLSSQIAAYRSDPATLG
jgi:CBS domain-containing protein